MERPDLPSAADLGVTEIEYERILRGLREREQSAGPWVQVPDDARDLVEQGGTVEYVGEPSFALPPDPARERAKERPASRKGRAIGWSLALGALLLAVVLQGAGSEAEDGPGYAFLQSLEGRPVTRSSCRAIPIAIYPAGGPKDAESIVREAVKILRNATGLDIVVTGVFGGHAPGWNFEAAPVLHDDPISVSWQTGEAIAAFKGEAVGVAAPYSETTPSGTTYLYAGTVALDREYATRQDRAHNLTVVLHEFGHALGLDHSGSSSDVMYPAVGTQTLGKGDREGLRLAGKGPCV
ncbi:hypothetical protein ABIE44_003513 [Marmoricola sp. OAE513]|uniref:matrixin family metalloprotease n=1 Tax=Marmoricola sp. OAE513 TaxID=2817894 RepID=UPI001AE472AD